MSQKDAHEYGKQRLVKPPAEPGEPGYEPQFYVLDKIRYIRQQRAIEKLIAIRELHMLQDEIKLCYLREGVNHFQNCRELTQKYFQRLRWGELGIPPPV